MGNGRAMRRVAYILFDNCLLSHFAGPMAAFEMAGRFDNPVYDQEAISRAGGPIRTSCGVEVMTRSFDVAGAADILFLVGGFGAIEAENDPVLLDYVRRQAGQGLEIAAVTGGAAILACTGLLDGRRATTHWSVQTELERLHPAVDLVRDKLIVSDGRFWTCATSAGGIEIARRIIERDLGPAVARRATRDLIVVDRRSFSTLHEGEGQGRYEELLAWARKHLREPLTIAELASRCELTERHFLSDFVAHMGETPAKAIERLRVEAALKLIETSDAALNSIARDAGFWKTERMRRAFIRSFGQSPHAMRQAFADRRRRRS